MEGRRNYFDVIQFADSGSKEATIHGQKLYSDLLCNLVGIRIQNTPLVMMLSFMRIRARSLPSLRLSCPPGPNPLRQKATDFTPHSPSMRTSFSSYTTMPSTTLRMTSAWFRTIFTLPQGFPPTSSRLRDSKPRDIVSSTVTDTEIIGLDEDSRTLEPSCASSAGP